MDTDGTQAPEPPKPFSDSLGGRPDNGSGGAAGAGGVAAGGENGHPPQPVGVNREAVQQLATALAAQEAASGGGTGSGASGSAPGSGGSAGADDEDDEPTAEIPPQRPGVRASAPALLAPIMRRRRPGQASRTRRPAPQVRKPSAGSAGFVVALTLMLIFLIIAIQFVASFVESVTSIFG